MAENARMYQNRNINSTNSKYSKSTLLLHKKKQNSIINTKEQNSQISFIQKEIETSKLNKSLQKENLSHQYTLHCDIIENIHC